MSSATDAFVARFSSADSLEWATHLGGAGGTSGAFGITTSATDVFVTGTTDSPSFPVLNPVGGGAYFQGTMAGIQDAFISRFSLAGVQVWTTYYGGSGMDSGEEPVVDAVGNLFVCGTTLSSNFPTLNPGGTAYYQATLGGLTDLFVLKFNNADTTVWATYYGGAGNENFFDANGQPLTIDAQGKIYMTGSTEFTGLPLNLLQVL